MSQKQIISQIVQATNLEDYNTERQTVEDALGVWLRREQLALNSFLSQEKMECLNGELVLAHKNGRQAQVEVIQRWHALISLLEADVAYTNSIAKRRHPTAQDSMRLAKAVDIAAGYGWTTVWSEFGTRIERIA